MNRAERRKNGTHTGGPAVVTDPARVPLFHLKPVGAAEQTTPDGLRVRMFMFHVCTPQGVPLVEQTPDGPQPVVITSMPMVVGRTPVLLAGGAARA